MNGIATELPDALADNYAARQEVTSQTKGRHWGDRCCVEGCESHWSVYNRYDRLISAPRAEAVMLANGWTRLRPGEFLCPIHSVYG